MSDKLILKRAGRLILYLILFVILILSADSVAAEPILQLSISINPNSGPPGTSVTMSGSGWTGNTSGHEIHWDSKTGSILGTFSTNPNGVFTTTFKVPSNASSGQHTIWVCDRCQSITKFLPTLWTSVNFNVVVPPTRTPTRVPPTPTPTDVPTECDATGMAGEIVVDFEGYATGTNLKGQTAVGGAKFLGVSELFVIQPTVVTHSGSKALQATFVGEFGSGRRPVVMEFDYLKDFVGAYVGLDRTIYATEPITATMTAWTFTCTTSSEGEVSCVPGPTLTDSEVFGPEPTPVKKCLSVEATGIYRVEITYGTFSEPELIDDLIMRNPEEPLPVPDDESPPIVSITLPEEGYRHVEGELALEGTVWEDRELDPELDVYINTEFFGKIVASGYAPDYVFRLDSVPLSELHPNEFNEITVHAVDSAGNEGEDTVRFLYAPPPTPTPTPSLDISIEAIEVTQVIQCMNNPTCEDNSVPLYMRKPTLVRLYVRASGISPTTPPVHGRVCIGYYDPEIFNPIECFESLNTVQVSDDSDPVREFRGQIDATLNVQIPIHWTLHKNASLRLKAEVNPEGSDVAECCYENNTAYENIVFRKGRELNIVAMRANVFGEKINKNSIVEGVKWILKYYPTSDIDIYTHDWDPIHAPFDFTATRGWVHLLIRLDWIRFWTIEGFSKPRYLALIDPLVDHGDTNGMAWMPAYGRVLARSSAAIYGLRDGTGDTAGHEMMHNHGLWHAPGGCGEDELAGDYPDYSTETTAAHRAAIGGWGIDLYSAPFKLFDGMTTPDIMSYCGGRWMSLYSYEKLGRAIDDVGAIPSIRPGGLARLDNGSPTVLVASGYLTRDGVELDPEGFFQAVLPEDETVTPDVGLYVLRLKDQAGISLYEQRFSPQPYANDSDPEEGYFFLVVPWQDGTHEIEILFEGQTLFTQAVSANAPQVTIEAPNGGEVINLDGLLQVRWSVEDLDGDQTSAIVQYSPDAGETWKAIAMTVGEVTAEIDTANLSGSDQALMRVCVSDGINTTCDESDGTFTVPTKSPLAMIISPEPESFYASGQEAILQGVAIDPEDGSIPDGPSYRWESSLDGFLGEGRNLWGLTLSIGRHVLTLEVVDSDGQTGRTSVEIVVGEDSQVTTETETYPTPNEPSTVARAALLIGFIAAGLLGLVLIGAALIILVKRRVP